MSDLYRALVQSALIALRDDVHKHTQMGQPCNAMVVATLDKLIGTAEETSLAPFEDMVKSLKLQGIQMSALSRLVARVYAPPDNTP